MIPRDLPTLEQTEANPQFDIAWIMDGAIALEAIREFRRAIQPQ